MALNEKKHPRLTKHLADKVIWVDGYEYFGKASDDIVVNIGMVGREDQVEKYLNNNPEPKDW